MAIEKERDEILGQLNPLIKKYCEDSHLDNISFDDRGIYWQTQTCSCCNDPQYWGLTWDYFDDPDAYIAKEKQRKLDEEAAEKLAGQKAKEEYERKQFEALKKKFTL